MLALESVSHDFIVQPLASAITGIPVRLGKVFRLGLLRSAGPFPHSILAGVFLGSFLPLYFLSALRGMPKWLGLGGAICSFFSISSAAILALVAGSMLIAINALVERVERLRWRVVLIYAGIVLFVLEFATKSGVFSLMVRFLSLNSQSSYNRVLIWRYGSASVREHPFFGIGYDTIERPVWMKPSIDNFWLLLSIQYGVLVTICLVIVTVLAVIRLAQASVRHSRIDQQTLRGLAIALAVFAFGIVSVSIWLQALVWYFFLLGICVTLGHRYVRFFTPGVAGAPRPPAAPQTETPRPEPAPGN